MQLRTAVAAYTVEQFDISRPKALLGHQNWGRLLQQVDEVRHGTDESFDTLYLAAAVLTAG